MGVEGAPTLAALAAAAAALALCWVTARATCCIVIKAVLEGDEGRLSLFDQLLLLMLT